MVGSPCSPQDSQESSSAPQFESIHSLALSLVYGPPLTSILGCWVLESQKVPLNPEEEAPALIYPVINPSPPYSTAQPNRTLGHTSKGLASNCLWAFARSVPLPGTPNLLFLNFYFILEQSSFTVLC